jgi:FkbM family methyltransferase
MTHQRTLLDATRLAGIAVRRAAEIGVFSYGDSAIRGFCEAGVACDLYEAVPRFCDHIEIDIREKQNVRLFRFAVSNRNGTLDLYLAGLVGGSTFAAGQVTSPALVIDRFVPDDARRLTVPVRDFSEVDDGGYDVVSIDIEGGEWLVLQRMQSRPAVLAVETHFRAYVNPHLPEIIEWCRTNGYRVWYLTKSDTVFFRGDPPGLPGATRPKLRWRRWWMYRGRI